MSTIKVSSFYKKITTENTDKAVDVIVCPDPALSECSDIDSDSDTNEESNKHNNLAIQNLISYMNQEKVNIQKVIIWMMKVGVITMIINACSE